MPNFLPVWSRAVPSLSLGTNPTRGQSAVKLIQGEKKQAGDWPDARGRYSRMVGTRRTELWRCNSPWAWVSNLWPPTPLSGEKLQYRWDGGGPWGGSLRSVGSLLRGLTALCASWQWLIIICMISMDPQNNPMTLSCPFHRQEMRQLRQVKVFAQSDITG